MGMVVSKLAGPEGKFVGEAQKNFQFGGEMVAYIE
jgi:hypothetical protein